MTRAHDILSHEEFAEIVDAYGFVDTAGLAAMIGRSHRTVTQSASAELWRTGHLPPPRRLTRRPNRSAALACAFLCSFWRSLYHLMIDVASIMDYTLG